MKMSKMLLGVMMVLVLGSASGSVFADQSQSMPPPPPMHPMMGPAGVCADQQHLYAIAAGKIMEYEITDMILQKTVDLPKPALPSGPPPEGMHPGQFPPPPIPEPHGVWTGDGFLYIMAGPVIYRYSTPDLTLQTTIELPKPELPKAAR